MKKLHQRFAFTYAVCVEPVLFATAIACSPMVAWRALVVVPGLGICCDGYNGDQEDGEKFHCCWGDLWMVAEMVKGGR